MLTQAWSVKGEAEAAKSRACGRSSEAAAYQPRSRWQRRPAPAICKQRAFKSNTDESNTGEDGQARAEGSESRAAMLTVECRDEGPVDKTV